MKNTSIMDVDNDRKHEIGQKRVFFKGFDLTWFRAYGDLHRLMVVSVVAAI